MAIYSMHIGNVSRAAGSSSVASASYILSEPMKDMRTGERYYGYGRHERVLETMTMLPKGADPHYADPSNLFNGIEMLEKSKDARTAKKIMVALPREFTPDERREVVQDFINRELTSKGYAAVYAIHCDSDGSNPHAHILVPNRQMDARTGDFAKTKQKMDYVRDEQGNRVPLIDKTTGLQKVDSRNRKQWKRHKVQANPLDEKDTLASMREVWEQVCNARLPEQDHIDHRSYEEQGKDQIPTIHEGYAAREIEKRGGHSPICEMNRHIRVVNRIIQQLKQQISQLGHKAYEMICKVRQEAQALAEAAKTPARHSFREMIGQIIQPQTPQPKPQREEPSEAQQIAQLRHDWKVRERAKNELIGTIDLIEERVQPQLDARGQQWREAYNLNYKAAHAGMLTKHHALRQAQEAAEKLGLHLDQPLSPDEWNVHMQADLHKMHCAAFDAPEMMDAAHRYECAERKMEKCYGKEYQRIPEEDPWTFQRSIEDEPVLDLDKLASYERQYTQPKPQSQEREEARPTPQPQHTEPRRSEPAPEAQENKPKPKGTKAALRARFQERAEQMMDEHDKVRQEAQRQHEENIKTFGYDPDDPCDPMNMDFGGSSHGFSR